jgi:hypothetical protein
MTFSKQKLIERHLEELQMYYADHPEEQELKFDDWLFQIDRNFIEEILGE